MLLSYKIELSDFIFIIIRLFFIVIFTKLVTVFSDTQVNNNVKGDQGYGVNTTLSNISAISWWRKPKYPEYTTDLSKVTDKLYHIMWY